MEHAMEIWYFFNEFILTDSDSSSSEEEDDNEFIRQELRPRVKNFIENVVDEYTDGEFRRNFRMNRTTFNYLCNLLQTEIGNMYLGKGRNRVNAKLQLLFTIWYFATPDSYRSICGRFDVGMATGLRIVRRVTESLIKLAPTFIQWPKEEYLEEVRTEFENKGFPNVIGCIDGCYIPIPLPKEEGRAYICRKNFACINMLAVCDHRLLFTYIYTGEAGSVHDATVLRNSEVWTYMNERTAEMFPYDTHLLGDKAYPVTEQLLTPYRDNAHLTRAQMDYNFRLSSVRSAVERSFGLLKKRFRILKFMDVKRLDWIPKYILACCVLHNICILQNDILDIEIQGEEDFQEIINEQYDDINRLQRQAGMEKRDRICQNL